MQLDPRTIIVTPERQRRDLGDLEQLKASIKEFGVIEPIVIRQTPDGYALVAGERRLRSALAVGLATIPCHEVQNIQPWQAEAMELEENYNRKQLTWQEIVTAIARVHELHKRDAALQSKPWGCEHTAALFGISSGNVSYCTQLADLVRANDAEVVACDGVWSAYQLLLSRKAKAAMAEQGRRISLLPTKVTVAPPADMKVVGKPDCVACNGTGLSSSGKPCVCATVTFEPSTAPASERSATAVIPGATGLSSDLSNDSFDVFSTRVSRGFDHIYCDPPYAIDMDNIQQANHGMDVSTVRDSHDVTENLSLLGTFCDWAAGALPDHGFLVAWCDYTMWDTLKGWLEDGVRPLRVQRWPFIWTKTSACQNGAPYSNFTKTTECAIVAAGPKATLSIAGPFGHWIGGGDKATYSPTNPFWKPLDLHKAIINAISRPGQTICDPFAGSGSIPMACKQIGRSIIANDYDPVHYNDMRSRLLKPVSADMDLPI